MSSNLEIIVERSAAVRSRVNSLKHAIRGVRSALDYNAQNDGLRHLIVNSVSGSNQYDLLQIEKELEDVCNQIDILVDEIEESKFNSDAIDDRLAQLKANSLYTTYVKHLLNFKQVSSSLCELSNDLILQLTAFNDSVSKHSSQLDG